MATGYINSPETVKAVETFAMLVQEGALTGFNSGDIPMTDGFGTGRYAMMLEGPWKTAELAGCPIPTWPMAPPTCLRAKAAASLCWAVRTSRCSIPPTREAAWKFMQFMTGEYAETAMAKCGQIPVNKAALESDTVKNADYAPFIQAIETAKARPTVAAERDGQRADKRHDRRGERRKDRPGGYG